MVQDENEAMHQLSIDVKKACDSVRREVFSLSMVYP